MQPTPNRLASSLRDYFANHLPCLRGMSHHTIHSYRDTVVLLLRFIASTRRVEVCDLDLADLQPDRILAFLAHLEKDRGNSVTTRNVRLAAIHAFFRYVGAQHPDHLEQAQRVLGVPFKRTDQRGNPIPRSHRDRNRPRWDRSQNRRWSPGLCFAGNHVQHGSARAGGDRSPRERSATDTAVSTPSIRQRPQRTILPAMAADRSGVDGYV
jgi:hypothetical protein